MVEAGMLGKIECLQGYKGRLFRAEKGMCIDAEMCCTAGTVTDRKRRVVLVVFIGGVTFAEIAALRFLESRPEVNCSFVVATTKLVNGTTLMESFVDDSVKAARESAALQ